MTDVNASSQDFAEDLNLIKDKPYILVVNKIDLGEKNLMAIGFTFRQKKKRT